MFQGLRGQRQAVTAVLADRRVTKLPDEKRLAILDSQWQIVEDFIPVLQALKCATTALGTEVNEKCDLIFHFRLPAKEHCVSNMQYVSYNILYYYIL